MNETRLLQATARMAGMYLKKTSGEQTLQLHVEPIADLFYQILGGISEACADATDAQIDAAAEFAIAVAPAAKPGEAFVVALQAIRRLDIF